MAKGSIDSRGVFIDVTVPVEHAQTFLKRIKAEDGYDVDSNNSYENGEVFHIRVTLRVIDQGACFRFIQALAQELGVSMPDNT
jgi:hypothetical protein